MKNIRLDKAEAEELESWLDEEYSDPRLSKLLSAHTRIRGEYDE